MANYSAIKAAVNAYIKANGKKEITGRILNSVLNATIDSLGKEFQFGGVLTPADDPGQPDQNVAYIGAAGTYSNFDNLVIESGNIGIFLWNGDWSFETIPVGKDYDNDIQSLTNGLQELSENIQELSDNVIHLDGINEEDLSIPEGGKLQFANRVYNAQQPNGMGYVILRKNKTFAEQVTEANTIYEIRYDFDLGGDEVTIPAGCELRFNGGILSNGTIDGDNTRIDSDSRTIFNGIVFSGTFCGPVDSEWFNLQYGLQVDNAPELNSLLNLAFLSTEKSVILRYGATLYVDSVDETIRHDFNYYLGGTVQVKSGVVFDLNGTDIRCLTNTNPRYNIIYAGKDDANTNTKDIVIKNGHITGDYGTRTTDTYEQGHGLALIGVDGFVLENLIITNCNGDGILIAANGIWNSASPEDDEHLLARHNQNGRIIGCDCNGNKRQGMSIDALIGCYIKDCVFENTIGIAPKCGVDIEPGHRSNSVKNVEFDKCEYLDNGGSGISLMSGIGTVSNIIIKECDSIGNTFDYTISGEDILLVGCNEKNNRATMRIYGALSDSDIKDCFISNLTIQDTTGTPHSTIDGLLFDSCDFKVVGGTGLTFINPLLSVDNLVFNGCIFDYSTRGVTAISCSVDFSKKINSCIFNGCDFYLRNVGFSVFHFDFLGCRFYNFGRLNYSYDGVHNALNFKDCTLLSGSTASGSYLLTVFYLPSDATFTVNFDNLKFGKGLSMASGLASIDSYSTQSVIINLGTAESKILIPKISSNAQSGAWKINGGFSYPSLKSGATTSRPVVAVAEGSNYFDTTLNKAIWYINGTWVDATGTSV